MLSSMRQLRRMMWNGQRLLGWAVSMRGPRPLLMRVVRVVLLRITGRGIGGMR